MFTSRRTVFAPLVLLFAVAACSEAPTEVADVAAPDVSANTNAATTERQTFEMPFPDPATGLEFVPVPAPCLGLGEPLQMSGTWTGWVQSTETAAGRLHTTEYIDYSQITVELGDLTWLPGPGANEIIVSNWPAPTAQTLPPGGFTYKHEFNTLFRSQDGLPDLRIRHSWKVTVTGNLDFVHDEFVPFEAECIGNGR